MEVRKYPAPAPPNPAVEALVKTMADPNWQTKMDLVEFEKTIAWLGGLSRWFSSQPATSRRSIFKKSKIFHFERGQSVFRQGDPPDYFYILISGQVDIHILSIDPHTHKNTSKFMSSIFPGDHFGDSSIIAKCPRTASCIAMQHTLCLGLSREYFVKTFQVSNEEIEWWKANVVGVDELPYSDLNRFAKSSTLQKFNLGTSFAIGGLKHLMFIRSGRAELGVRHPDIGIKTLGELKVGDCFGEAGMFNLNQSSWVVTATGEGPLMVLAVPHEMMWEFPSLHDRLKRLAVARQNYLEDKSIKQPSALRVSRRPSFPWIGASYSLPFLIPCASGWLPPLPYVWRSVSLPSIAPNRSTSPASRCLSEFFVAFSAPSIPLDTLHDSNCPLDLHLCPCLLPLVPNPSFSIFIPSKCDPTLR